MSFAIESAALGGGRGCDKPDVPDIYWGEEFFLIKESLISGDAVVGALFKMKRDEWGV